jgi:hypothetical protein
MTEGSQEGNIANRREEFGDTRHQRMGSDAIWHGVPVDAPAGREKPPLCYNEIDTMTLTVLPVK